MKISAMPASSAGTPGANLQSANIGTTASAQKLAAAKAVAQGLEPEQIQQEQQAPRPEVRRITMKTNVSPNRFDTQVAEDAPPAEESTIPDTSGQTNAAAESTQPLSPQFAALAKQRRALQVKEREIAEREAKITAAPQGEFVTKEDLIANPLKIFELGLTYDQLTEAILSDQSGANAEIQSLKQQLKDAVEGVDKKLNDRDAQAEQQVLAEMKREAQSLIQQGDAYEMVRETGSLKHVMDLIYRTYKKHGEVMDISEALNLVETDLINETLKIAKLNKVRSQLAPEPVQQQAQSQGRQMRTLTNRDSASIPMDRKARAIAAMNGTLKR